VIRNAVIHVLNEQPLLADLFEPPSAADVGLRCTNLRTMSGNRPVFIDASDSTFFFPYRHIRFVELPAAAEAIAGLPVRDVDVGEAEEEPELELDEDFLRRIREA
jgi:hypothetical protein